MKIKHTIFKRLKRQKNFGGKKSGVQFRVDYCKGELKEQIENGVIKTREDLITASHCTKDNFVETCKFYDEMFKKKDNKMHEVKMHEFVQSPSPEDEISPEEIHEMGVQLGEKYFKDYPHLVITHIDGEKVHNHILVANWNVENGKAFYHDNSFENKVDKYLQREYTKRGLENSIIKKDDIYKKEYNKRFYQDVKEKMNMKGDLTDKQYLGLRLKTALQTARSWDELKLELKENNIEIYKNEKTNKTRIWHPEIVNKKGKRKGEIRKMDTEKLDDEYKISTQQIEDKINENALKVREDFEKKSLEERENELADKLLLNQKNAELQQREIIRNEYNDVKEKAFDNADKINENEVKYHQTKNDYERHQLMQEREKLFAIQKDLRNEMIELNKKFEDIQSKIDELNREIEKKYDDKDKRIINDNEQLNRLPLDNDLNKLPQKVNPEIDKTRNDERVISDDDMNGNVAEETFKHLQEERRLDNADTKAGQEKFDRRNENNDRAREDERYSDRAVGTDGRVEENVSGTSKEIGEENRNITVENRYDSDGERETSKTDFEDGRESQELRGAVEESRKRVEQAERAVERSREELKQSEREVEHSREELKQSERANEKSSGAVERENGESQESGRRKHKIIESQGLHI